jgi:hypothetical protein
MQENGISKRIKLGVMGISAGSHVASTAGTNGQNVSIIKDV